jgi:hypothetical protein
MGNPVSIRPDSFVDTYLCFEDALKIGSAKSSGLQASDFDLTSVRPCVDGLIKRYKSFARQYKGSVFSLLRDASWHWASFCEDNEILVSVTKEYFSLLRDLTENYNYTDLEEKMDVGKKIKEVGYRGRPLTVTIPREAHGVIADCGVAVGTTFSLFYQVGLGWSLSRNSRQLYKLWSDDTVQPLFDEVMAKAEKRLEDFLDIRDSIRSRELRKSGKSP